MYDVTSYLAAWSNIPSGGGLCPGVIFGKGDRYPPPQRPLKLAVHTPLECILVLLPIRNGFSAVL